jgi:hypothetical protein
MKRFLEVLFRQFAQGQMGCKIMILAENLSLHATMKFTSDTAYFIQLRGLTSLNVLYKIVNFRFIQL